MFCVDALNCHVFVLRFLLISGATARRTPTSPFSSCCRGILLKFSFSNPSHPSLHTLLLQDVEDEDGSECLLSFIAQLNPSGWIWEGFGYQQAFLKEVSCTIVTVLSVLFCVAA